MEKYPIINGKEFWILTKIRFDDIQRIVATYLRDNDYTIETQWYNIATLILTSPSTIFFNMIDNRHYKQLKKIVENKDYSMENEKLEENSSDYKNRKEYSESCLKKSTPQAS